MKEYNKLVRDKIPEIIAGQGKSVCFRILKGNELKKALKDKLIEETQELINARTEAEFIEEMADVIEVLYAIRTLCDITDKTINKRAQKYNEKGGFEKGYFLERVSD